MQPAGTRPRSRPTQNKSSTKNNNNNNTFSGWTWALIRHNGYCSHNFHDVRRLFPLLIPFPSFGHSIALNCTPPTPALRTICVGSRLEFQGFDCLNDFATLKCENVESLKGTANLMAWSICLQHCLRLRSTSWSPSAGVTVFMSPGDMLPQHTRNTKKRRGILLPYPPLKSAAWHGHCACIPVNQGVDLWY